MHECMNVRTYECMNVCVCMRVCVYVCVCMYVCLYVGTYVHTNERMVFLHQLLYVCSLGSKQDREKKQTTRVLQGVYTSAYTNTDTNTAKNNIT